MKKIAFYSTLFALVAAQSCKNSSSETPELVSVPDTLRYEQEVHLKNVRQLTFGGDNAEAYWSFDGSKLVFQVTNPAWDVPCDQIYIMDGAGLGNKDGRAPLVSTGKGRTT